VRCHGVIASLSEHVFCCIQTIVERHRVRNVGRRIGTENRRLSAIEQTRADRSAPRG
jgi:hypothetical protein